MYSNLCLRNFKCFRKQDIALAPLTVLTGLNGSGKSSVIQSLLVCRQTEIDAMDNKLHLNGYWTELGAPKDVLCFLAEREEGGAIVVTSSEGTLELKFFEESQEAVHGFVGEPEDIVKPLNSLSYISASRWGPRASLPMDIESGEPSHVGKNGEYTFHYLAVNGQKRIPNQDLPEHKNSSSRLLDDQVSAWLSEITPGTRLNAQVVPTANVSYSTYAFPAGADLTPEFKATNVAFGLSYTLPVIVAALSTKQGGLLLIENPEAHLHPAGQTAIAKLLAQVANTGVQVIVETHSDHVIDGMRIAVKQGEIAAEQVSVNYFVRQASGISEVIAPKINPDGSIEEWPEGFFDQAILNLATLGS